MTGRQAPEIGADVAVIGGGLHGCATAFFLAQRGAKVVVIEKNVVARHASGVNAGGVRLLGRAPEELPLAFASMEIWHSLPRHVDSDGGFRKTGQLKVAETETDMRKLEARAAELQRLGYRHEELIDAAEVYRLAPALRPGCIGALLSRQDGSASPYRTTTAFKLKGEALGVRFLEETRVVAIERPGTDWALATTRGPVRAPVLVNCAGAWGDEIAGMLGEPVPMIVAAPMMIVTARMPRFLVPRIHAAGRQLSFNQTAEGSVLIGGGYLGRADRGSEATELNFRRLARGARHAVELFPIMRDVPIVRCWVGIEGVFEDQIPVIGASAKHSGLFHAFGFCGHGFQLGPGTGATLAELILNGRTNVPLGPFRIDRFALEQAA